MGWVDLPSQDNFGHSLDSVHVSNFHSTSKFSVGSILQKRNKPSGWAKEGLCIQNEELMCLRQVSEYKTGSSM